VPFRPRRGFPRADHEATATGLGSAHAATAHAPARTAHNANSARNAVAGSVLRVKARNAPMTAGAVMEPEVANIVATPVAVPARDEGA
jgi:hypothetical protein